jgi:hypothetical protein
MALTPSELRRRKMNLLMAMSYAAFASTKASTWSPTLLFAAGEQGAWYDPSDFSTMFQDSAGTTPVTAVEQPVGLILDKSKGLALGSELVTNGGPTFTVTTGWTAVATSGSGPTLSVVSSKLRITNGAVYTFGGAATGFSTTVGAWYTVTVTAAYVSGASDTGLYLQKSDSDISATNAVGTSASAGAARTMTLAFAATATTTYLRILNTGTANATFDISLASVKSLAGNHASQSTSASRPVLSARVNLLTYSEQFDNAAWTKASGSITATNITDPLGGSTADAFTSSGVNGYVASSNITVEANTSHTFSVWLKVASGTDTIGLTIATTGLSNIQTVNCSVTTDWQRFTVSGSVGANTAVKALIGGGTTIGTGEVVHIWGADLRVTNDGVGLPAYQRVGAAVTATTNPAVTGVPDYDTSGFPLYLKFDGVDDWMATDTITPPADKAQLFAGVRKLNDTGANILMEMGVGPAGAYTGSLNAGNSITTGDASRRTWFAGQEASAGEVFAGAAIFTSPDTRVFVGLWDRAGSTQAAELKMRLNGLDQSLTYSVANVASGNFAAYPLYIGARYGTSSRSLFFSGRLYSYILRFSAANLSDAQIASTETWVNGKTGAY